MKRLRVLSYAINGRGMGHLVRQLAILRWMRRITALLGVDCEIWVLTSSEADTLARREGIPALKMPSKAMLRDAGMSTSRYLTVARAWVLNAVAGLQPDVLVVDTFPGGSFGELLAVLEMVPQRVLVARQVRDELAADDSYRALLPLYQRLVMPDARDTGPILIRERAEMLDRAAARAALGVPEHARAVYVTLGGGGDVLAPHAIPALVDAVRARGWHVVVGAGPLYTGAERRGDGITWMDRYVPMELFSGLDAAVSAGGYNSFHELMYAGVPTVFLPQPRIADDQRERVLRAVDAGAGRLAQRMEDVPALLDDAGDAAAARALVPHNGARRAALSILHTVLPAADLDMAERVLTPELLALMQRTGDAGKAMDLVKLLCGATPSQLAQQRALLASLAEADAGAGAGGKGAAAPHERVQRYLAAVTASRAPLDTALSLTRSLHRKFPAASGDELLAAAELLFPVWARFDDWMGALSILRAVPVQRSYGLAAFAGAMAGWLAREDDLFDALRAFSHLERSGQRPVVEVLHLLRQENRGQDTPAAEPAS